MKKNFIIVFFLIFAAVFISYFNSLNNPFIWDDEALVVRNPLIRSLALTPKAFTSDLYNGISAGSNFYRPLQNLSYSLDYSFWGLNSFGYHLTNLILHTFVSCLVFIFLFILTGNLVISVLASLLFAVNPLSTEAVAYVSGRAEMLLGICLLGALILFIKSLDSKYRPFLYTASLLCFISGLLSKELALVFPLVLAAYLHYFKKLDTKAWFFLSPYFLTSLAYVILRLTILNFSTLRPPALTDVPFYLRLSVLPKVFLTYLKLSVLPLDLHMSRTLLRPTTFTGFFIAWFALGLIVVWGSGILLNKNKRRILPFMVFWFIVFILPQSGLFAINAFVSEHFIYLSSISIFLGLVFLLNRFLKMRILIPVCAALILFYGTLTVSRIYDWKDPLLFYQKIIKFSPDSFQAHNNLGLQYEFRNKLDLAAQEYLKAIAIKPDLLEAHSNLANLYFKMGLLKEAKQEYAIVEKIAPAGKAGEIQNNIGCVYEVEGRLDEALEKYNLALKLDPSLSFAHFNIARISLARKDFDRAASEVLKSLPETLPAKESIRIVREQLASGNSFADGTVFYNDLGVRFAQSKDFVNATRAFKRSLELRPMYADAHFNLGLAYWNMGKKREAELAFKDAIRSGPGHARAEAFLRERVCKK